MADPDEIAGRHVVVDGHRLHYLDWGDPADPTVVLIHGHGLTAHTWDRVAAELTGSVRCLALDLRGHGDSEWSPAGDYRVTAYARDLAGFIRTVAGGPVVVVGHSLGGIIALRCAIDDGAHIRGVVVVDMAPDSERRFRSGVEGGQMETAQRMAAVLAMPHRLDSFEAFVEASLARNPSRNPEALRTVLRQSLRQLPDGAWSWKYDRRHYEGPHSNTPPPDSPWPELDRVGCPVLVVRGGRSDVLTEQGAAEFVGLLPDARWTAVPNAGHSVQVSNPSGLVEVLRPFLAELGASR